MDNSTTSYDFGSMYTSGVLTTASSPYQSQWDWSNIAITTSPPQYIHPLTVKGIDMKGNGKEFLVFVKGAASPVKACESEAEALEEAAALADKNDDVYFVYRAIKRVAPVRTDLEVTDL